MSTQSTQSTTIATESSATETVPVTETLTLKDRSDALVKLYAEMQEVVKRIKAEHNKLQHAIAREEKRAGRGKKQADGAPRKQAVKKPVIVSAEMVKFMKANYTPKEGEQTFAEGYTRDAMMRALSSYVKANSLQCKDVDGKKEGRTKLWLPNPLLVKLLGLEKGREYRFIDINGLVSRVVIKPTVVETVSAWIE